MLAAAIRSARGGTGFDAAFNWFLPSTMNVEQ